MQSLDQAVGELTIPELDVNKGYGRRAMGDQAFGFGYTRGRPRDFYTEILQNMPQGLSNVPSVLNDKRADTSETARGWLCSCGHSRLYRSHATSCSAGSLIVHLTPSALKSRSTAPPIS